MKTSEKLKEVLSFLDSCESSIVYYQNEVENENKRLYDFAHYIEFEEHAENRSKKCTEFKKQREHRRKCKDKVGELEPIVNVLKTKEWKRVRNLFSQALGEVRRFEAYKENRKYNPKAREMDLDNMIKNAFKKDGE